MTITAHEYKNTINRGFKYIKIDQKLSWKEAIAVATEMSYRGVTYRIPFQSELELISSDLIQHESVWTLEPCDDLSYACTYEPRYGKCYQVKPVPMNTVLVMDAEIVE
jgi:hypothetical protein